MTPEERAFNAARAEIVRGRTALLTDTRDEIVRDLKAALQQIQVILADQPTDYQLWSLPRLAQEIRQALAKFGEDAAAQLSTAAGNAWQLGQDLVDKPLAAGGVRTGIALAAIDTRQLQAMRAFMTDRIKDLSLAAANQINTQVGLVVIGAQSPSDAISATRLILGEQSRSRATMIVRDNLSAAYSSAAFQRLQQQRAHVPGLQKQWRKSGKLHPRPHHDLADGQAQDVNEPFRLFPFGKPMVEIMFPHDPTAPIGEIINCGCIILPFKSDWTVQYPGRSHRKI